MSGCQENILYGLSIPKLEKVSEPWVGPRQVFLSFFFLFLRQKANTVNTKCIKKKKTRPHQAEAGPLDAKHHHVKSNNKQPPPQPPS